MTLEQLILSKKIDIDSANIYALYTSTELGAKVLRFYEHSVMFEDLDFGARGTDYAKIHGRRTFVNDIKKIILQVNKLLSESN